MAARRSSRMFRNGPSRWKWLAFAPALALALVLAYPVLPCEASDGGNRPTADSSHPEKNKNERERCKRAEGERVPRGCPDGGERLPQDKRSPLDSLPPLSPLVA